jgi:hypothetical protein
VARKAKLPGAADFFKADDEQQVAEQKPAGESKAQSSRRRGGEGGGVSSVAGGQPTASRGSGHGLAELHKQLSSGGLAAMQMPAPARSLPQPPTEKITFYVPSQMLQQLEVCRVRLLTEHGLKANRSQIVQAALALTAHDPALVADTLLQLAEVWEEQASD